MKAKRVSKKRLRLGESESERGPEDPAAAEMNGDAGPAEVEKPRRIGPARSLEV